jgi:hypothetical protein
MRTRARIETKVIAGLAGSGAGSAFALFTVWLLGVTVWGAPATASAAEAAVAAVPSPVSTLVVALLAAAGSFLAAYSAPHTPRTQVD